MNEKDVDFNENLEKDKETIKRTLPTKEAAEYLNVSLKTFRTMVKAGKIPFVTPIVRPRFRIEDLDEWLNNTQRHIDYTRDKADRGGMRTSRLSPKMVSDNQLEYLQEQWTKRKRSCSALNISRKSTLQLTKTAAAV